MTAVETRTVEEILGKALDGERIADDEAVALLRSRELVPSAASPTSCAAARPIPTASRSSSTGT